MEKRQEGQDKGCAEERDADMRPQLFDFNPATRDHTAPAPALPRLWAWIKNAVVEQPYVMGADLSHWNSAVDFARMYAAGYRFVILKATEATGYVDPTFDTRWKQARDAGLIIGAYHFFRGNFSGIDQAEHHLNVTFPMRSALNGCVIPSTNDVETADGVTVGTRQVRIQDWHRVVRPENRNESLCYSSPYLWKELMNNMALDVIGFTAHWTSAIAPSWPAGWPVAKRKFWQIGVYPRHSWAPPVPGVAGECDVIKFLGTLDDLKALAGQEELSDAEKLKRLWDFHPEIPGH